MQQDQKDLVSSKVFTLSWSRRQRKLRNHLHRWSRV